MLIFQIVPPSDPKNCIVVPLGFLFVVPLRPLEYSLQWRLYEKLKIEENITTEIAELKNASKCWKNLLRGLVTLQSWEQQETSMIVDSDLSLPEVEEVVEEVEDEQLYTPLSDE